MASHPSNFSLFHVNISVSAPLGQKYVDWHVTSLFGLLTHSAAQKNKATSYHLGQLKAKIAKLRRELINPTGGGGGGGPGIGFDVARYAPKSNST